jgi:O-antigen/teichoic acid export membrane protein
MQKVKDFLFKNVSTRQTIAKNTFWLFASETIGRLLKMGLVIYAARVLGVQGWGIFSYAISIASLLMIFTDIGLSDFILREATQKKDGNQKIISTAFFIKITILTLGAFLVISVGPLFSHIKEATLLLPIIAFVLFFDSLRELGLYINRASEKMERDMIVKTLTNGIIFGLGVILLKIELAPKSIALAYAIGSAVGFITIAVLIRKDVKVFRAHIDQKLIGPIFRTIWPFTLVTLIGVLMGNIDVYLLGIWKNATEIGLYAAMQRIPQFILILPSMIAVATFPLISRLAENDQERSRIALEKTLSLIMLLGIPVTFGILILGSNIVYLVFGPAYINAVPILRILILSMLSSFPMVALSNAVFAHNEQRVLVPAYATGILTNILLNLIFIPQWGAQGAALAAGISTIIITTIIWYKKKKTSYFEVFSKLKKALAASMIMGASVFLLNYLGVHVIINIVFGIFIYIALLYILKEPLLEEAREIIYEYKKV